MPGTINCVACGKVMSDALKHCPHCRFSHHESNCRVCGNSYYSSNLLKQERMVGGICRSCFNEALEKGGQINELYSCPACKSTIKLQYDLKEKLTFYDKGEKYHKEAHLLRDTKEYFKDTTPEKQHFRELYKKCSTCGHPFHKDAYPWDCKACGLQILQLGELDKYDRYHEICKSKKEARDAKNTKSEKSNCFIATASCGVNSIQVVTLRKFRDEKLVGARYGKTFVKVYELASPPIANVISRYEVLKLVTRRVIVNPLYHLAKFILRKT